MRKLLCLFRCNICIGLLDTKGWQELESITIFGQVVTKLSSQEPRKSVFRTHQFRQRSWQWDLGDLILHTCSDLWRSKSFFQDPIMDSTARVHWKKKVEPKSTVESFSCLQDGPQLGTVLVPLCKVVLFSNKKKGWLWLHMLRRSHFSSTSKKRYHFWYHFVPLWSKVPFFS